ncbi:prepilin-type N-terminal cleavage/methylation domain-containing protein [Clostridium sp. D53t1_180928_C8]|uniref:type II secretion system protein n=1 Tax=Clostridium sp. D53t1_180928_C8 TaxID=2787101 RepID=UPI002434AB51|nr:prepilin-type N-terminal cleavage/methylation domain-containing protein [Clostridium sp. D53t1_180928_C8]
MNLTKMKKKKGFTLIELMAVIAIIAILAAVLVPTVTGYINRSKKTAIITQVRTAVNSVEAYNATADSNQYLSDDIILINEVNAKGKDATAKLTKAELLYKEDIDRLNGITLKQAREINNDKNALDKIKVAKDGTIESYNNEIITKVKNN